MDPMGTTDPTPVTGRTEATPLVPLPDPTPAMPPFDLSPLMDRTGVNGLSGRTDVKDPSPALCRTSPLDLWGATGSMDPIGVMGTWVTGQSAVAGREPLRKPGRESRPRRSPCWSDAWGDQSDAVWRSEEHTS